MELLSFPQRIYLQPRMPLSDLSNHNQNIVTVTIATMIAVVYAGTEDFALMDVVTAGATSN